MSGRPLIIWAVSDGRAGIEAQVVGLAEAVARHAPALVVSKHVAWRGPAAWLPPQLHPASKAWLKDPTAHFRPQVDGDLEDDGVCGALITEKLGVSQPTASEHLRVLVDAGFLTGKRIKQWIFYQRDEKAIAAFLKAARSDV